MEGMHRVTLTCGECGFKHRLYRAFYSEQVIYIVCHKCECVLIYDPLSPENAPIAEIQPAEQSYADPSFYAKVAPPPKTDYMIKWEESHKRLNRSLNFLEKKEGKSGERNLSLPYAWDHDTLDPENQE